MSIKSMMPSSPLILYRPLLLLPSIFPSIRVFSNESLLCIRQPEYQSFSFNISISNEYPGLISCRMDWLDLAVQGTLKSLLQHHSSKASILWCSAFFTVQLSHPYMTTGPEKFSFHPNPKERQCQRMFKLPHNCTYLTHQQSNAQNSPSESSTVCEL